ncbi:CoA ester lyase [Pikeienuella piscinae]|uniref:CoA ester lyase n=1 Tax=Pikeienuella piscinae TaxID=2748098 RepID=A0A7L5C2P8_9RHOB|nr:CoA ester lyase [Pikeienuella piscinae]QIE56826.1 CoA ester lyase [Pikeienuella piscinae]
MPVSARPRRSVLYIPGCRARALEKARRLAADALIFDLEDAAPPEEKENARTLVADAVSEGGYGARELIVRINGLDTEWGAADLATAAVAGPDAILIPKVESPEMIAAVAAGMSAAPAKTAIWAMMETPRGVLSAAAIAASHPRLVCLVMGTNDLVKELRATHVPGRAPVAAALGHCLLAARAEGLVAIDGVCNAFRDETLLREECEAGRAMGFDGKTLIHPGQIAIANEVFGPSAEALAEAKEQLAAYEATVAKGGGVAVVNGRIVENLHVETARRLLAEAEAIRRLEDGAN